MSRRVGYLGSCGTPLCGAVSGYFCVRCKHYVSDCLCSPGSCLCANDEGWASGGERRAVLAKLAGGHQGRRRVMRCFCGHMEDEHESGRLGAPCEVCGTSAAPDDYCGGFDPEPEDNE